MTSGDANERLEGAFLELIEEKPFAKITVNDIVERAGVHRNTFYYHYQSIPAMLSEICRRFVSEMFVVYKDVASPSDCVIPLVKYSMSHKEAMMNVYNSEAKPILMDYVKQIGRFSIDRYIDAVTERTGITRTDKELMAHFLTAGIVGIWTDWVDEGMGKDATDDFIRIGVILEKLNLEAFVI
ncbi:MAG: TetR/AcrR family transcriptional regulator [Eubacteriales bacterium]|nr:TetR/AcrR family transcriptional regulator [Lachnospiraceae bacterium]MDO4417154.1 TetR/AcrR family transcriptional regulator [Eubacteriales bacterium]